MTTTQLRRDDDIYRYIMLPNQSTYFPYCSELVYREVLLSCRAIGDPEPMIDIYEKTSTGSRRQFHEAYRANGELVAGLLPIRYGENILIYCTASNIASFVSIHISLTYTCKWFVVT